MANPFSVAPLGGLQTYAKIGNTIGAGIQNYQAEQQQQALQAEAQRLMREGSPQEISAFSAANPEIGKAMQQGVQFASEQTRQNMQDSMQRVIAGEDPVRVIQERAEMVRAQGGDPSDTMRDLELAQQDPEAYREMISRLYAMRFGTEGLPSQGKPTAFMQEMQAAGIEPGSDQFKAAVLERYGKGKTIGYDVVEAVNPNTGRNEYFQVSRTDPGDRVPLGLEVPQDPRLRAKIEEERQAEVEAAQKERDTVRGTMDTIDKILKSDGLSGFSGLDSFRRFIPGTEAANVAAYIEQLQSQNFLTAVEQMKGMGALSENEGKKLSSAVAALSPSMSDEAIKRELNTIRQQLAGALEKINSGQLQGNQGESDQTVNWSDL